jgi:aryl-alcohol dehydrogenase-like predicted oxidoreductase
MIISRICLGAAQLGMNYGINNVAGQPSLEESRAIVRAAVAGGITTFDTAPAYGESERVLGECLGEFAGKCAVVSKLPGIDWRRGTADVSAEIRRTVETTISNLKVGPLAACLFHRFEDMYVRQRFALGELAALREAGLVVRIGASVYTPEEAEACLRLAACEVIQAPFNLADKRLLGVDFFRKAKAKGKVVFVRSVYLQGIFFKPDLPAELRFFASFRQGLEALAAAEGLSLAEMALRYALSFEGIDSVIVGVETAAQLAINLEIAGRGGLPRPLLEKIRQLGNAPERAVDPRQWPKERENA